MPGTDSIRMATSWCFGCNAETWHEERLAPPDRAADGLPRRTRVCTECGVAGMTVVELPEGEFNRLRRSDGQLAETRRTLRQIVDAVLAGEDLPAPFRRTEAAV
jgi:hypothetical protein